MKKSLLMLAVLGAFAGAASAQTNVTLYGVADVGIQRADTLGAGNDNATWSIESGIQSGSRLGFKGTEDLGGGLSGIFALETGFNIDNGSLGQGTTANAATATSPASTATTRIFGRQAWVGLNGGFGAVKLGRQYTPVFTALDTIDPFGTGLAGDISRVFNHAGVRMDNTINYTAPSFGGLNAQIAYGLGETVGSISRGSQLGASLGYANGPINVVGAYHDSNFATTGTTGDNRTAFLGATYDLRVVKAHAAFAVNRAELGAATLGRSRDMMLGVSAPIGAGTVLASVIRHDQRTGVIGSTGILPGTATAAADFNQIALGYTHNLSKRTNLYTSFGYVDTKTAGAPNTNLFNVGVRHKF